VTIDPLLTLAHTVVSAPGTQAILLGSGVSRSAQVLTGWEVTLDLVRRLAVMEGAKDTSDLETWYTGTYGKPPDYSDLLLSLAKTGAERRSLLQSYFEPTDVEREVGAKSPTPAHHAIAQLVAKGFVRVILTTNFDRLMETALRDEGVEPIVVSTADGTEGAAPVVHQRCLVVKLHGDYLDDRVKNTEVELQVYDPRMDQYLDRILDEFGLIICGWSGEWDPALRAALERCKSRRYTTTWVSVGEPSPRAKSLIALRGAQVVVTTGADAFFQLLTEKVGSVEELKMAAPTSVAAAVAALKRYLAEDRHRFRLEDLLLGETNQLVKRLREEFPFQGGPTPTIEMAKARVRHMDAACEITRSLFFHGCRLCAGGQEALFLRALVLLAPPEQVAGYTVWAESAAYPMASLLYAGALGALLAQNWSLLRSLLTLRYRVRDNVRVACDRLAARLALPDFVSQSLFQPQRRHTPVSDHFFGLLSPLAAGLHPEPELLFDELEVWVGLAYLDAVRDLETQNAWFPPGRFCWQGRFHDTRQPLLLFATAEEQGKNWPPLAGGWFKGKVEQWQTVKAAFEEGLTRLAQHMW
jgi:SIR2-like domain